MLFRHSLFTTSARMLKRAQSRSLYQANGKYLWQREHLLVQWCLFSLGNIGHDPIGLFPSQGPGSSRVWLWNTVARRLKPFACKNSFAVIRFNRVD